MTPRVQAVITWAQSLFPVRVWLHFLNQNGLILAAGMSFQALFAVFAAVYVGFSIAGIWLIGQPNTIESLAELVNTAVPGLIGESGIISVDDIVNAGNLGTGLLTWTAVIAGAGLIWTAIGWITFSRMSVRAVLGLEKDRRNYFLMKARDLLVALALGGMLLVAAALSVASTEALHWIFEVFGLNTAGVGYTVLARLVGLLLVFAINTFVLAMMFRFLSRATIQWRRMWGGSILGGLALLVLQLGGSLLAGGATRNPLLATFAVFVAMLVFFRITSIVTLVAAAWIAVGALDREEPLVRVTREESERRRRAEERDAILLAARVRVRDAEAERDDARWYQLPAAQARLRSAKKQLAEVNDEG